MHGQRVAKASTTPGTKRIEIFGPGDADLRLRTMFRWGGTIGIAETDFPKYAAFLELLSDAKAFDSLSVTLEYVRQAFRTLK